MGTWPFLNYLCVLILFHAAKGLNLYQVLAPNSFSYVDGYISAINRNVHSLVYQRVRLTILLYDRFVIVSSLRSACYPGTLYVI